jgi:L-serine dehydratase
MALLFDDFKSWREHCVNNDIPLHIPVLEYETAQRGRSEKEIHDGLMAAWLVMKEAVQTGLTEEMNSRSGMIKGGGRRVINSPITVLSLEFKQLVARALAAKEVNACMGRIVAAPTAGASGIMPGVLYTLQDIVDTV